ncbi:non-heme iron oxygenase ferredoxin subunit [Sphingobium chlorophenolicum]|uniref:Rieske (2Fe-2S) domain protein n=1 Tax=Sphingobium chlorophenolicum TaxID=46429 RepID=A0A081RAB2_SPHCR|nr:non-heme iron oxygenase ferredoxin subunit [Sphingobium chlorophenolicum]KEQ52135.1 Rieske (2Fe-2S) domain protein [Sphingobium chlorophenolicum]
MIRLCSVEELDEDEILRVELDGGHGIAVYLLDGEIFATDDLCTHGEASLAEGEIEDGKIVCPFHLGSFDIRTGAACAAPCSIALKTYPVEVIGGDVHIAM